MTNAKWGKEFWEDLAERVGTSAVGGAIAAVTTTDASHLSWNVAWTIIVIPSALSLLKGLYANLSGGATLPSASLVKVSSTKRPRRRR